ncbi:MAG: M42 family metallopeptidase [Gemmatimonadota bacterium]
MTPPTLPQFLTRLLDAPGPSGFEGRAAAIWREEAESTGLKAWADSGGNSYASVEGTGGAEAPRVLLVGHIDEIGLQVTYVDGDGYLYVDQIGGWDPQVLVGQRVRILTREGEVSGVVGKKPIHLMKEEDRQKVSKLQDLWVDVGVSGKDEVEALGIRVGDAMVLHAPAFPLQGDRFASRAVDNRIGAYVVLEALKNLQAEPGPAAVVAMASAQEEIGYSGGGARTGAYSVEPHLALVVDVTFSTDVPDVERKEVGEHRLGGGPVLTRGSAVHPTIFEMLADTAIQEKIACSYQAAPRSTRTDADGVYLVRGGVPTGLVSIPNRYMHSPNEVVSLSDVDAAIRLLAGFVRRLPPDMDLTLR